MLARIRRHPVRISILVHLLLGLAVLSAIGLFSEGGLQLADLLAALPGSADRVLLVLLCLVPAAALITALNTDLVRESLPWALCIATYLAVGSAVLLDPGTAGAAGLHTDGARAQAFALVSVAFVAAVAGLGLRCKTGALAGAPDLVASLSLKTGSGSTVLLLWTAVVVYAIALIGGHALLTTPPDGALDCSAALPRYCIQPGVWTDYLILLGVPGAATVLTKLKGEETKADDSAVTATVDGATATSAVTEVQYLVFNAFAMLYVVASMLELGRLPAIPDLLLALSGASALVYALNRQAGRAGG